MRLYRFLLLGFLTILISGLATSPATSQDWPNWRGPHWNGTSENKELPLRWAEGENIAWSRELPGWGNSSPTIIGDSIFLTSQEDDEKLLLLRLDKSSGEILWKRQVGTGVTPRKQADKGMRGWQKFHVLHNLASPTVAADREVAVAHFGNGDTAAYDWQGNQLWYKNMQEEFGIYTIWWGHANTPVLYEDLVIMVRMQDNCADMWDEPSKSFLVAFDKKTGEKRWYTERDYGAELEAGDSYCTPTFWRHEGRTEILIFGAETIDAYLPASGERTWWLNEGLDGIRTITGPLPYDGTMVYVTRGKKGPLCAVRPEGRGELDVEAIQWHHDRGTPDVPTPVIWDELLFVVSDRGMAKCLDPHSGEVHWEERLPRGIYYASPLAADGYVYFLNTEGTCTVVKAAKEFEVVAENQLEDKTLASIAVSDGLLYIRGHKKIHAIGKQISP
jgi:outer membrane protein assembly factor BamB